jgi:hypothetical protein
MTGDKERIDALEKQGWIMRFVAGEPRLSEAVEIYRHAGFEVLLEPLPEETKCKDCPGEETDGECRVCFNGFEDQYKIIFTRRPRDRVNEKEELF